MAEFPIVDLTDDVRRAPIVRAEKAATELHQEMLSDGERYYASSLIRVILALREALE